MITLVHSLFKYMIEEFGYNCRDDDADQIF